MAGIQYLPEVTDGVLDLSCVVVLSAKSFHTESERLVCCALNITYNRLQLGRTSLNKLAALGHRW